MTYKGYEAIVEFDEDENIFTGEVINTRDVITFEGTSVEELQKAFADSVEDYLAFCKQRGEEPDKPFSGTFTIRMTPDQNRQVALEARRRGMSINAYAVERLSKQKTHTVGGR